MSARLQSTMFLLICWIFVNIALGTHGQSVQKKWDINITETINSSKLYYLHDLITTIYNQNPTVVTGLELDETCNEAVILFDSTGDTLDGNRPAQDFETYYDAYDNKMADDFGVDECEWIITGVVNIGYIQPTSVTFPKWNVIVYDMSGTGGFPGNVIDERLGLTNFIITHTSPTTSSQAEVMIVIDPPIKVDTGDYWLSVQADMDILVGGQWFWATSLNPRDNRYIWKENGGFGTGCTEWDFGENCFGAGEPPTALFSLIGCKYTCNPTNAPSLSPTQSPSSSPTIPWKEWEVMGYFKVGCPCGMISMWYGDPDTIPSGYTLCDGDLGTPDLRDKFIVGAGGDFAKGETDGSDTITIGVANLPAHNHGITAQPTDSDAGHEHPTFTLGAVNDAGSAHLHVIAQQTSGTEPDHNHPLSDALIDLSNEPAHSHVIPAATTDDVGSNHAHVMQAFADKDVPDIKITGIKAEQILDGAQPLSSLQHPDATLIEVTQTDGAHTHGIPADNTGNDGGHSHGISGVTDLDGEHAHTIPLHNTNTDGGHTHGVSGSIGPDVHGHTVSGVTGDTGDGDDIDYLPPYGAVYFICCIHEPGSW